MSILSFLNQDNKIEYGEVTSLIQDGFMVKDETGNEKEVPLYKAIEIHKGEEK